MIKVLLVDDDIYIIENISIGLDKRYHDSWDFFLAYNIENAKKILLKEEIDVIVCDIEMPMGSGLNLVEWIRQRDLSVQTIFLTNYSEFEYARRALTLKSFDYLLKPVEIDKLGLAIERAAIKGKEDRKNIQYQKFGREWVENISERKKNLYQKITNTRNLEEEEINSIAHYYGCTLEMTSSYQMALIVFESVDDADALGKICMDISEPGASLEAIWETEQNERMLLIKWEKTLSLCDTCWKQIVSRVKGKSCVFLGDMISPADFYEEKEKIRSYARNNLLVWNKIIDIQNEISKMGEYHSPDYSRLELYLLNSMKKEAEEELDHLIHELDFHNHMDKHILRLFRFEVMQVILFFGEKKTGLERFLETKEDKEDFERSVESMTNMSRYLRNCIARVFLDRQEIRSKSVIEQIISYVDDHLQEDISRKTLAELFYLHPNSIGRLFRQETGQSLGQYLISKRMNIAKQLLEETKLPVNVISMKLGYDNFSYFTKCFKEYAECSPSDYRKRYRNYPG